MSGFVPPGYFAVGDLLPDNADQDALSQLRLELYRGDRLGKYVDPVNPSAGHLAISKQFWATDAGQRVLMSGRIYPLGEGYKGNQYISGADGAPVFFSQSVAKSVKTDLPQKPGPKDRKPELVRAYKQEFPHGHEAAGLSLSDAAATLSRITGLACGRTTLATVAGIAAGRSG